LRSYENGMVRSTYQGAARERARWMTGTNVLLVALVLSGLVVSWLLSTVLARAFRREEAAHARARAALESNEELIAVIAHDLRNPLGAIAAQASMLRAQTTDSSSRRQAASIENVASRMEYLIRTVVDTSMVETHRFVVVSGYCEVGGLVDAAMEMFQPVAAS